MQTPYVQSGPALLKAMPIMQKTSIAPTEHYDLSEKMPGMTSVKLNYQTPGLGSILDINT